MRCAAAVFLAAAFAGVKAQDVPVPTDFPIPDALSAICPDTDRFLVCAARAFPTPPPCATATAEADVIACGCEFLGQAATCFQENCGDTALNLAQGFCEGIAETTTVEATPTATDPDSDDDDDDTPAEDGDDDDDDDDDDDTSTGDSGNAASESAQDTTGSGADSVVGSSLLAGLFAAVVAVL